MIAWSNEGEAVAFSRPTAIQTPPLPPGGPSPPSLAQLSFVAEHDSISLPLRCYFRVPNPHSKISAPSTVSSAMHFACTY